MKNRHITWDIFQKDYIEPSVPAVYTITGLPDARFYVVNESKQIGVQVALEGIVEIPPVILKEISIELKYIKNKPFIDFSTTNIYLFQPFYSLMISVSDLVHFQGVEPLVAIERAIEELERMTATIPLLAEEKVVGMWGELWVLERLLIKCGVEALYSWKGPSKDVHDFRQKGIEIEVKTTRNEEREHVISRLSQLEASPGYDLWLCSIQVVSGNQSGKSLTDYVARIVDLLNDDKGAIDCLDKQLNKEGYYHSDGNFYTTPYSLRSDTKLVEVDVDFACLNRALIVDRYAEMASRISDVSYRINVNGLGIDHSNKKYIEILGSGISDD